MSNFSSIGFPVTSEVEYRALVEKAYEQGGAVAADKGTYVRYVDKSRAELWIQVNQNNQLLGANPHFHGKSRRTVCLTATVDRSESELDGAFHAWAAPREADDPESGEYPFVFDLPDFRAMGVLEMPKLIDIQLAAFARGLSYFASEEAYFESQETKFKMAAKSFIPSGLFAPGGKLIDSPLAAGIFTGIIEEWEKKTNDLTGESFYWLLVETLGGEVDVVADPKLLAHDPEVGGVLHGQFWLSGRLIDAPTYSPKKKGLFGRLFGQ